jgi:septal ring factor EnvC (AmiA/AmiB activator)
MGTYWRLAAVLLMVFGLLAVVFFSTIFSNATGLATNAAVKSEIEELEMFYSSKIDEKLLLLTGRLTNEPIVQEDLDRLQTEYLELKRDLKDNADSEEVIAAMIMNYKVRLQLLERMIYEIHDDENESNNNIHL